MILSQIFGITDALADTAAPHATPAGGLLSMLPMLIIFIAVFYFLLIRPQAKRTKDHRQLVDSLTVGDEVIISGGITGRITKLRDDFVALNIAKDVEITVQKSAIATVLPKGTLESI
jgi:preprotein translocase subunit YajC